jgi:hypothetical protein
MFLSQHPKKKLILAATLCLPILFGSGWMLMKFKNGSHLEHADQAGPNATGTLTMSQSPQNVASSSTNHGKAEPTATQKASDELSSQHEQSLQASVSQDGCFSVTFKHKVLASHSSDDECSHHRNLIKLPRTDVLSRSVCIRVNGTPVRHKAVSGKPGEFVIGAVAGPNDTITARFCVGKAKCSEACPYPKQEAAKKDEFLEAISGESNDDGNVAQWEAADVQKNNEVNQALSGDLKKAVEEQDQASQRTSASNTQLSIFKHWIGGEISAACIAHASKEPSRSVASAQLTRNSVKKAQ